MNFLRHAPDEQSPFDINTAVEVCLDVARPLLTRQQVTMRTELSPDISICVGDFVLVRQAILNLIYNACQAMEAQPDPREITIATRCETNQLVLTMQPTVRPQPTMPAIVSSFRQFCSETTNPSDDR